jgi:hypothetical protein
MVSDSTQLGEKCGLHGTRKFLPCRQNMFRDDEQSKRLRDASVLEDECTNSNAKPIIYRPPLLRLHVILGLWNRVCQGRTMRHFI